MQESSTKYVGIRNAGNNCWLNSTLQGLKHSLPENLVSYTPDVQEILATISSLTSSNGPFLLEPEVVLNQFANEFDLSVQNDAGECLLKIMNKLHMTEVIDEPLIEQKTHCLNCNQLTSSYVKPEPVTLLQLSNSAEESVQNCVDRVFIAEELIGHEPCQGCFQLGRTKQVRFVTVPQLLLLVLKRFDEQMNYKNTNVKIER